MGNNFTMADIYGHDFGYATTRMQSIPEENDQEVLLDENIAAEDVHTDPAAKRNMMLFVIGALVLIVLFSMS